MPSQKINKTPQAFSNRVLKRNNKLGSDACEIMAHAIQAVDPYDCVYRHVLSDDNQLVIGDKVFPPSNFDRIFLIGFGKASVPMAKAVLDVLDSKIHQALVVTKDPSFLAENGYQDKLHVLLGGHPLPTTDSVKSTKVLVQSLPELTSRDLILVVISGGGSALFSEPVGGVTIEELYDLNQLLIKSGANIAEINTIRKHLDLVKGGRLAERLQPAQVESFILSDVIGDQLDMISSGPTVPDLTTYQDALNILTHYNLFKNIPKSILDYLEKGNAGHHPETLKPGQLPEGKVGHHLVGANYHAAQAALSQAVRLGYHAAIISTALKGQTKHIAEFFGGILHTVYYHNQPVTVPACLIFGGEPTVQVTGDGLGGRNMDLILRLLPELEGKPGALAVSLATDGEDGPTDAAGAAADGLMMDEASKVYGLDINSYVKNNNSYHFFEQVGGLIKIGATGTNVNDLIILLIDKDGSSTSQ
jgi:glycerate 2-kinase